MTPRQSINERLTFDSYWELIIESPSGKFFIETITGKLNWYEDYTPSRVTPGFSILFFHRFCFVFSLVLRKFLRVRLAQNVKEQGIHYQTILNTSDFCRLRFKFSFWLVTDGRWFVSHAIDSCGLSFISIFFY